MTEADIRSSPFLNDYFTTQDALKFEDFRPTLRSILLQAQTPLTVGIFGPWGSGKTSLLRMLRKDIADPGSPRVRSAWVTAWKYDRQEALWRVMILSALDALWPREEGRRLRSDELTNSGQQDLVDHLARLEESVYRPVDWQELGRWTVDWLTALKGATKMGAEIAGAFIPGAAALEPLLKMLGGNEQIDDDMSQAVGAFKREVKAYHREQLVAMEQFESAFAEALELADVERLVVFVDDLDRCLPEKAIEVLEAIKLFLEVPGAVFVLGMDKEVVERGVQARYREWFELRDESGERLELPIRGDAYLQKMVQIPFHLPPLTVDDLDGYIENLEDGLPHSQRLDETTRAVLSHGLYPNPRQVKRALNVFRLLKSLVEAREKRPVEQGGLEPGQIAWPLLAKTLLIQHQWPELYRDWQQVPILVRRLEEAYAEQPVSEEQIISGVLARRGAGRLPLETPPEEGEAEIGWRARSSRESSSAPVETSGGLLEPYLSQRRKYALLERLLTYPPESETGEGRERARFAGLSRAQMQAYLLSVSAALEGEAAEAALDLPAELSSILLSGDTIRVQDAIEGYLEREKDPERRQAQRASLQGSLVSVLSDPQRAVEERVNAGNALAGVGDPRFDLGDWYLPVDPLLDFIPVPVGPFLMGSDPEKDAAAYENEQPQHEVHLPEYYIARHPTTVAQFHAFSEDEEYQPADRDSLRGPANHPAVKVSWHDAMAYCRWLSELLQVKAGSQDLTVLSEPERTFWSRLAGGEWVATLPSEAQWEKAARGNDGRIYPWGDDFNPGKANTDEAGLRSTSPVGCFPGGASPYGALDMCGNVWEWTRSLWGKGDEKPDYGYPYDPGDGRENLDAAHEVRRVLRGGAFHDDRNFARCAFRRRNIPGCRYDYLGFRVALAPAALVSGNSGL